MQIRVKKSLRLEPLEDRTLLAVLDGFDIDAAAFETTDSEVETIYEVYRESKSIAFFNGSGEADLTIYTDLLPSDSFRVSVTGFTNVEIVGERALDTLIAKEVGNIDVRVDLDGLESGINGLHLVDVDSASLQGALPVMIILDGEATVLSSELGFTDTLIISSLDRLALLTEVNDSRLDIIVDNPEVEIFSNFEPLSYSNAGSLSATNLLVFDEQDFLEIVQEATALLREAELTQSEQFSDMLRTLALLESLQIEGENTEANLTTLVAAELMRSEAIEERQSAAEILRVTDEALTQSIPASDNLLGPISEETLANGLSVVSFGQDETELSSEESEPSATPLLEPTQLFDQLSENQTLFSLEAPELTELVDNVLGEIAILASKAQSAGQVLRTHFIDKLVGEFTPGERPGLVVDTKAPIKQARADKRI